MRNIAVAAPLAAFGRRLRPVWILFSLVSGTALAAMMILTAVDVVSRYVFNQPVPGSSELTELLMGLLVFCMLPLATARQEHIVTDAIDFLMTPARRRVQMICSNAVSMICLGCISWRLWIWAADALQYGNTTIFLRIPLGPLAYLMSAMAGLTTLIMAGLLVAAVLDDLDPFPEHLGAEDSQRRAG